MPTDMDAGDAQDQSEVFDEDNTNIDEMRDGGPDAEQFEDLVDVFDATTAVGDSDDDASLIGEELDDDEIIELERESDQDDADLEDDDLMARDDVEFDEEEDLEGLGDVGSEDLDDVDGVAHVGSDEVELSYAGDLNDLAGAESGAQDLESSGELSNADLQELDYRDEDGVRK